MCIRDSGEVAAGLMFRHVPAASPEEALTDVVDRAVAGDIGRPPVASVAEGQLVGRERPHRAWTGRRRGLAWPRRRPRKTYLRNFETKGEVSPRRMKCPDGPSPRNSENHDSCSISSFRIASERS